MFVRRLLGAFVGAVLLAPQAFAEDPAQPAMDDGWKFDMATYIWAPGLSGDATIKGNKSDLSLSFIDIVRDSDSLFAYNGQFGVSKGDFGLLFTPTYISISASANTQTAITKVKSDLDVDLTYLELVGFYRVGSWPVGYRSIDQTLSIEPLAGVRYTKLWGNLRVKVPSVPGKDNADGSQEWVDPIIGARSILTLTEDIDFTLRGDVGGFGIGSEFTWQLASNLSYRFDLFGKDARAFAGYRALYQHYKDGSGDNKFEWDATLYGPILGLSVIF